MSKPRVTATHEIDALDMTATCSPYHETTPAVVVRVEFDLHDHQAALVALDRAVNDVRNQIEETKP